VHFRLINRVIFAVRLTRVVPREVAGIISVSERGTNWRDDRRRGYLREKRMLENVRVSK